MFARGDASSRDRLADLPDRSLLRLSHRYLSSYPRATTYFMPLHPPPTSPTSNPATSKAIALDVVPSSFFHTFPPPGSRLPSSLRPSLPSISRHSRIPITSQSSNRRSLSTSLIPGSSLPSLFFPSLPFFKTSAEPSASFFHDVPSIYLCSGLPYRGIHQPLRCSPQLSTRRPSNSERRPPSRGERYADGLDWEEEAGLLVSIHILFFFH